MKIAMLTGVPPLPTSEGMRHRTAGVATALASMADLEIHVVSTGPVARADLECSRAAFGTIHVYVASGSAPDGLSASLRRAFDTDWVSGRAPQLSAADKSTLVNRIKDSDAVWVHTLHVADRVGQLLWDHTVLDYDDLVSEKQRLLAKTMTSIRDRLKQRWAAHVWRRWELQAAKRFSAFSVCSEADAHRLKPFIHAEVVPNAIDPATPEPCHRSRSDAPLLGFLGLVKYPPNFQGLTWFIRHVWPLVRKEVPTVRLRVVGRLPEQHAELTAEGVDLLGFVADPADEIAGWSASVVPLLVGGGTRLKIIESVRAGCPVVSTSVGAYGLELVQDRSILLGDSSSSFAEQCIRVLKDPKLGVSLVTEARRIVSEKYLWPNMRPGVEAAVRKALSAPSRLVSQQEAA